MNLNELNLLFEKLSILHYNCKKAVFFRLNLLNIVNIKPFLKFFYHFLNS